MAEPEHGSSPLAEALARVGDRWTLLVVEALLPGPRRFNDLLSQIPSVAATTLSDRLKRLERDGLLVARPYSQRPPRAAYQLTAEGTELADAMQTKSDVFSKVHIAMIRAGEKGGFLEGVLTRLGQLLTSQADLRAKGTEAALLVWGLRCSAGRTGSAGFAGRRRIVAALGARLLALGSRQLRGGGSSGCLTHSVAGAPRNPPGGGCS